MSQSVVNVCDNILLTINKQCKLRVCGAVQYIANGPRDKKKTSDDATYKIIFLKQNFFCYAFNRSARHETFEVLCL